MLIDTATHTLTSAIAVGAHPGHLALSPDGTRLYVNGIDDNTISVISL